MVKGIARGREGTGPVTKTWRRMGLTGISAPAMRPTWAAQGPAQQRTCPVSTAPCGVSTARTRAPSMRMARAGGSWRIRTPSPRQRLAWPWRAPPEPLGEALPAGLGREGEAHVHLGGEVQPDPPHAGSGRALAEEVPLEEDDPLHPGP